jgi:murein DD-endopeptidase
MGMALAAVLALSACASPGTRSPGSALPAAATAAQRAGASRTALAMVGAPYRYAGSSPAGFDCSGLVVYSYARAGVRGLPHSAEALERRARPLDVAELEPGDLLFFDLEGKKSAHVAIYVGESSFVHAPSAGRRVERVSFEHVYWGPRIERAGRIAR